MITTKASIMIITITMAEATMAGVITTGATTTVMTAIMATMATMMTAGITIGSMDAFGA